MMYAVLNFSTHAFSNAFDYALVKSIPTFLAGKLDIPVDDIELFSYFPPNVFSSSSTLRERVSRSVEEAIQEARQAEAFYILLPADGIVSAIIATTIKELAFPRPVYVVAEIGGVISEIVAV